MAALPSEDFIPAPIASENADFIPAPIAQDDEDFIPSTLTPEQTVVEALAGVEGYSAAVQTAAEYGDNPTLRPLFVKALADRQKKQASKSTEDSLNDAAKIALALPGIAGRTLYSVVTESIPAVANNVKSLFAGNPAEQLQAVGEAGSAISGAAVSTLELLRKGYENVSDSVTFSKPSLSRGLEIARNPLLIAQPSKAILQSDEEYERRADADLLGAKTIKEAASGGLLPGGIREKAAALGSPIRPEVSEKLQVAYDPLNWVPFGAGFVVGKVGNALGLGVRTAGGVEVVAKGLQKLADVEKAAETVGVLRRGVGATVSGAGQKVVRASDSPAVVGTIAGATALAGGAEPITAMLASLIGAGTVRGAGPVADVLKSSGRTLVRVGDQIAGKASLGPMGRFAESAVNFVKPSIVEGGQSGLALGLPFALSARDEQDVADVLGSSAAFGVGGHLVGQVVGAGNRYFSIDSAFRDSTAKVPDSAYERPEFSYYSQDQGNVVEAKSREVFDTLSNKGAQTVEALKKLFVKPDANGIKTEIYILDRATSDALAKQYAGSEQGRAGFSVEIPDQKRRLVVINADSNGGISLGHETGHAFYASLPYAQKKALLDTVSKTIRPDDFAQLKTRYEELFNQKRNEDGSYTPVPEAERVKISDDYAAQEYLAENFSAYLNGVPIEKFGTPRGLADRIRVSIGAVLEKGGARRLTTDNSAAVRTELGYKPSAALAELYQNFIEARKLDNTTLTTINGEAAPVDIILPPVEGPADRATNAPIAPVPANAPASPLANIREVEAKPVVPGFKKGDPIGEIRDKDGMLIAEEAKVLRKNEDGTYEIEFIDPDTGKRLIATTDEASLVSPISPGKVDPNKTVFPASPVTPQTPFFAATAPIPPTVTPPTAATTVAPKQVENVARPQGSVATPNLRPGAASAFVKKAPDTLHSQNRKVLEDLMLAPRAEIPAVETDYYAAASPVQSPDAIVRAAQRKAADALEKSGEPNPFRATFNKLFVPYRWSSYKLDAATNARLYGEGTPRQPGGIYGMSVDKVGQNLDLLRGLAKENLAVAETLSDFGVSQDYLASDALVSDFRTYLDNQAHGYGGDGRKLSLPADTRPGTITAQDPNFVPTALPANKRQLFNLLLNLEQQSTRTPGMEFSARFAKQNGIDPLTVGFDEKGRPLTDNNALRAALLQKGFDPRILNSAVENLPTENFTSAIKARPDVAMPAADVAITQAGFMPEISPASKKVKYGDLTRGKYWMSPSGDFHRVSEKSTHEEWARTTTGVADPLSRPPTGMPISYATDELYQKGWVRLTSLYSADRILASSESPLSSRQEGALKDLALQIGVDTVMHDDGGLRPKTIMDRGEGNFMPETPARRPQGNDETRSVAAQYTAKAGIQAAPHDTYAPTNETTLKRIADFYENAKHEPEKPEVQKAYRALAEETRAQYDEMLANGIKIEPYEGKGEPYANSAAMLADIRDNKHLYFFLTKNAFGEGADSGNNALLEKSGIKINGVDLLYNDLFRAVHDYFGHTAEGFEFGPRGEYNAYLAHSRMFSDEAKPALAAETLAQNAWVNFGPQLRREDGSLPKAGDADFVPIAKRRFADQKNTVVPPELLQAADPQAAFMPEGAKELSVSDALELDKTVSGWLLPNGKTTFGNFSYIHEELARKNGFKSIEEAQKAGANRIVLGPSSSGEKAGEIILGVDRLSDLPDAQRRAVERLARENDLEVRLDTGRYAAFMPEDSQLEGFGESMREKMRAKMAKVEPSGYEEGDRLELPSGRIVEFVSDLLPKKGGARDGAQMAYVRFEDGMESSVYLDDLTKTYGPGGSFMPEAPDTPEFKKWTRGAPVVLAGESHNFKTNTPVVVEAFHGSTVGGIERTSLQKAFFSDSPEVANTYAEPLDTSFARAITKNMVVQKAFVNMQRPLVVDASGAKWHKIPFKGDAVYDRRSERGERTWTTDDLANYADRAGYDGLIVKNVVDDVGTGDDLPPSTVFVTLGQKGQIKSATGNRGTFDATNPDIRYMPEVQFDAPKKLPDAIKDRTLTLVHKGPAGIGELDPARFGKSGITPRSELAGEPRVFFYVKGFENKGDPSQLRGNTYEIPVSGKRIYDADTDALDWTQDVNRQRADIMLKDAGYAGLIRTRGKGKNLFKQVEIFEKVSVDGTPVSETDVRTPRNRLETPEGRKVAAQLREKFGSTGAYFDRLQEYKETGNVRFMPEGKRRVEEAAIRFDGEIFTGTKHYDAFERMQEQGFIDEGATTDDVPSSAFGFVDNKGKFMTRVEAAKVAEASGQLSAEGIRKSIWNLPEGRALEADGFDENRRFMPETDDVRLTRPYKEIAKFLTPEERSKIRKDTAQDMVDVFKELPPDSEFEAAAKLGMLKKGWYERAGRSLRTIFGNDTEKFVGVLAATSPRQSVQLNMEMAFDIWEKYLEAGRPEDAAKIRELVKPLVVLEARENNTVRALLGKDLEENPIVSSKKFDNDTKMSGFKVESFRRNLLGDLQASTNDAWMAQFAGISQTLFGTKSGYAAFNAKVRRVADTLDIKPAEVQETVWSFFKTLVEGTQGGRSSAETLASLTQGDILNTPEFHEELLKNPKVAAVLERLGIDTAAILDNENPAKAGADPTLPLAGITLERGQDSRRVLERVVARAQKIKDQSLADEQATRSRVAPTDDENPF